MEKSFKNVQARELKRFYRHACEQVLEEANEIRSTIGMTQNLNYEQAGSNAQGAQYTNDCNPFRRIDFTADVSAVVKDVLTEPEYRYYKEKLEDKDFEDELKVQSVAFMSMQERLGKAFKARGLWPVSKYFKVVKK
jgi:hypothetical protein